jgi:hypothetical protein
MRERIRPGASHLYGPAAGRKATALHLAAANMRALRPTRSGLTRSSQDSRCAPCKGAAGQPRAQALGTGEQTRTEPCRGGTEGCATLTGTTKYDESLRPDPGRPADPSEIPVRRVCDPPRRLTEAPHGVLAAIPRGTYGRLPRRDRWRQVRPFKGWSCCGSSANMYNCTYS